MNLNLLSCYQIVFCEEKYFLCKWNMSLQKYECLQVTDEKPEYAGHCLVFFDRKISTPARKRCRLWWIDEDKGVCLSESPAFDKWMYYAGRFICCDHNPEEKIAEETWDVLVPDDDSWARQSGNQNGCPESNHRCLVRVPLGRRIGDKKFTCFVYTNEKNEKILTCFQLKYCRSSLSMRCLIDDYMVVDGIIWYRIGDKVAYSEEELFPDGSKSWCFTVDSDGLNNWNRLTNGKKGINAC